MATERPNVLYHIQAGSPHFAAHPGQQSKRVLEAAKAAKMEVAWLPFRAPELNPCEDLWRLLKSVIAANRTYASLEEEAERAVAWLDGLTNDERLRRCGLKSSKFQWLTT